MACDDTAPVKQGGPYMRKNILCFHYFRLFLISLLGTQMTWVCLAAIYWTEGRKSVVFEMKKNTIIKMMINLYERKQRWPVSPWSICVLEEIDCGLVNHWGSDGGLLQAEPGAAIWGGSDEINGLISENRNLRYNIDWLCHKIIMFKHDLSGRITGPTGKLKTLCSLGCCIGWHNMYFGRDKRFGRHWRHWPVARHLDLSGANRLFSLQSSRIWQ